MLRIIAVALVLRFSSALLPPQFQETLLCPVTHCLIRKPGSLRVVGPKRAFFTCASPTSTLQPIVWLLSDGADTMRTFRSGGYHSRQCGTFADGLALLRAEGPLS